MSKVKVLILAFFAAFALSAIASSSAQAGWLVLGSLLVGSAAVAGTTITDKEGILTFSSIEIGCATLGVKGGVISEPDKVLATSLEFGGCKVIPVGGACTLASTTIGTLPLEGLVTLDGPLATKGKAKPENAEGLFATFKLNGASCSSAGKEAVTGTAEVLSPEGQDERLWHLLNALIETAGELKVGEAAATISGSALFQLQNDMLWSFD
jgi:hypothetical protein